MGGDRMNYYGIKDGKVKCKASKIVYLHKDIEFFIELDGDIRSGDFYDYETKKITPNPESINRIVLEPEPTELDLLKIEVEELKTRLTTLESAKLL